MWRKQTNKQNQCIIIRNDDEDVLAANHKYDDGSLWCQSSVTLIVLKFRTITHQRRDVVILSMHNETNFFLYIYIYISNGPLKPVSATCYLLQVCWHDGFSSEWTGLPVVSGLEWAHGVESQWERGCCVLCYKYPCHTYIKSALQTKGLGLVCGVFFTHVIRGPWGLERSAFRSVSHSHW